MKWLYALSFLSTCLINIHQGVQGIGINYGLNGDNFPPPGAVISLLKSRNIPKLRLFEPNHDVLDALQGSGISAIIGTRNEDLQSLSSDISTATKWVETNISPYSSSLSIACIAAGNEVVPSELANYVPAAMQNLNSALRSANLAIPVTTAVSMRVLSASDPPLQGLFSPDIAPIMTQVTTFLQSKRSPLLVNAYPYYPRTLFPSNVLLDYALFEDTAMPNPDGSLTYRNLFDARVDAVYAALEKAGGPDVEVVVAETGWPTEGSSDASIENAEKYNNKLVKYLFSTAETLDCLAALVLTFCA